MGHIPQINDDHGIPTLYVKDQPFFALSGEIHNSSASNLEYMEKEVWPRLKGLNMNSVIVPIYWETIEPEEGVYDFSLLDGIILQARENQMHLIFLWFGLWKNGESMYVPSWMKKDPETYFRAKKVNGEPVNTISPLCQTAIDKDAACFAKIMAHIKEVDEQDSTVITIQVENEIGLLRDARDYGQEANSAFEQEIPEVLAAEFGKNGTWKTVFEEDAEEFFMAYYFAKAVEQITKAGRDVYPLPCYTNAWLKQYPWYPGSYPSGGPVPSVHKIWKCTAPSLFALGPDIYVPYVADVMDEYANENNPLFVPETRKDAVASSYCMYAFGKHNAICFSPFGVEELTLDPDKVDKPPMEVMIALNIDPSAFDITGSADYLGRTYQMIKEMQPLYLQYRGTEHLQAFCRHGALDNGTYLKFKEYDVSIAYAPMIPAKPLGAGMIYELSDNKFLIAGMMSTFVFRPKTGENLKVDVLKLEEGNIVGGTWKSIRIFNGDEKMSIKLGEMPGYYMIELFKY